MELSNFIPLRFKSVSQDEQLKRADEFMHLMNSRRSVRDFSDKPIPKGLIEKLILTAGSAPSGANKQPWKFVVVIDPVLKKKIREAAEKEERLNYEYRFTEAWKKDLHPFGTDWHKEFLEIAPALIVVFKIDYGLTEGQISKHYYVNESVGIAVGFLLCAIHNAGLCALTHTPSPMNFLQKILNRPKNEKPFLLIPVGYPVEDAKVPNIFRKDLSEILIYEKGDR